MSDPIVETIAALQKEAQEWAVGAMTYPKAEPFEHGVQIGVYRGLLQARQILEQALKQEIDN